MLIAVLACALGILVEHYKWPQDREAVKSRFLASERPLERISLLAELVLNHSLVRWLIAFATASTLVLGILLIPSLHAKIVDARAAGRLSLDALDATIGLVITALMALLSVLARRIAS
jgi:hypothetical protein